MAPLPSIALSLGVLVPLSAARAESIAFPPDAGVINVREAPYLAKGDGLTDDTAAIQRALTDHPNQGAIIYLPNGTYLISETLHWPHGDREGAEEKNTTLQGQSEADTIVRLRDWCRGYSDPSRPKPMLWTGKRPAQRFGNALRNLTLDTGTGNPGAIGARFMANNHGGVRHVTIRCGASGGPIGLDLGYTDEQGPCLLQWVTVVGFDVGISAAHTVDSITLEHIILRDQRRCGLRNDGQCLSVRDLQTFGTVPGVINGGVMTLIEAELSGYGAAAQEAAIRNSAALYARQVKTHSFGLSIENTNGGTPNATAATVEEFTSHPVLSLFPSPPRALGLEIMETPLVGWDDPDQWVSPTQFGARPDDEGDDTAAIQAAIDSGKATVYLPRGTYRVSDTIIVRSNVHRLIGCEATVEAVAPLLDSDSKAMFRLEEGPSSVVRFERLRTGYGGTYVAFEHASRRTLALSSVALNGGQAYRNVALEHNSVFLEDVCGEQWAFSGDQEVWARQLDVENEGTKITNGGATLWVLGLKTERGGTLIETRNGGRTEVLGGLCYTTYGGKLAPMFVNSESSLSATIGEVCYGAEPFEQLVVETRGGEQRVLSRGQAPAWIGGSLLPLYAGYQAATATAPPAP